MNHYTFFCFQDEDVFLPDYRSLNPSGTDGFPQRAKLRKMDSTKSSFKSSSSLQNGSSNVSHVITPNPLENQHLIIHRYFSQHHRTNQRKNLVNEDTHREISQLRSVKIQNLIHLQSGECHYHAVNLF